MVISQHLRTVSSIIVMSVKYRSKLFIIRNEVYKVRDQQNTPRFLFKGKDKYNLCFVLFFV